MKIKLMKTAGIFVLVLLAISEVSMAQRQMEKLDRGVLAVKVGSTVHVSWRIFGNEYFDVSYNVYRNSTKLNNQPITAASYYVDSTGTVDSTYSVSAIVNGVEQTPSTPVTVWAQNYKDIPLQVPAGVTTPDSVTCTYSANDCSVGDLDGDGQYEIIVKWDPSNSKDNSQSGYTGNVYLDAYKMDGTRLWRIDLGKNIRAGAHYTQFMVYDLDGDGKAEVACKTAPGTKDGSDNYIKLGPADSADHNADYRNSAGYVLSGPEYFTIFNGETGNEMTTVNYLPPRGSVNSWGDNYGNRVDRFLACIAYLDGVRPSVVMCRGYYTRTVLVAWDWRDGQLTQRWIFDSDQGYRNYMGQGNHNLSVADVDDDGKDEIIYGSCTIDDDGTGLYSTGLGHGDALHVSDLDPLRKGLEVFAPHEDKKDGVTFRDAATGEVIWQVPNGNDVGRALAADVLPGYDGVECWAASGLGMYNDKGGYVGSIPSINFAIWWDGDDLRELLDGTSITKYSPGGTLLSASGCSSNNGTKSTPNLSADILGDWREEVIFRLSNSSALRIFATTYPTTRRLYTLMHDPVYRLGIAWQNTAYNQPPHTGFFLGYNMTPAPPPPVLFSKLKWENGTTWGKDNAENWTYNETSTYYTDSSNVLFDISGSNENAIEITDTLKPGSVTYNAPKDYIFTGNGVLSGSMRLIKAGSGTMIINNDNNYIGESSVWDGELEMNGILSQSHVFVNRFASIGGSGVFAKGVTMPYGGNVVAGKPGVPDTLRIEDSLYIGGKSMFTFDLSDDTSGISKPNDVVLVNGDLKLLNSSTLIINKLDDKLSPGIYKLIQYTGNFTGNVSGFTAQGLLGYPYEIMKYDSSIAIRIIQTRPPTSIVWKGDKSNVWDQVTSLNWLNGDSADWFVANDTVVFCDSTKTVTNIQMASELPFGEMRVNSTVNYTFNGPGYLSGTGKLTKSDTAVLNLLTANTYSGGTVLEEGTLFVNNTSGSATGTGPVTVKNGAILSGNGSIEGVVTVEDGGTLSLQNGAQNSINLKNDLELSSNSNLVIEVINNLNKSDTLNVSGQLTLNGNLVLVNIGSNPSYVTANKFKILNAPNCIGKFSAIIPETPGEFLKWDTTGLAATGIIKVAYYTGVTEETADKSIILFPNPVKNSLLITFAKPVDKVEISISDVSGKLLLTTIEKNVSSTKLDVSFLVQGIYIVRIKTGNNLLIHKIIKQ